MSGFFFPFKMNLVIFIGGNKMLSRFRSNKDLDKFPLKENLSKLGAPSLLLGFMNITGTDLYKNTH